MRTITQLLREGGRNPSALSNTGMLCDMQVAVIGIYVAIVVVVVVAWNANADSAGTAFSGTAFLVWSAASLALGWIVRHPLAVLLPLIAIPIAVPFGYAEEWLGSDAPLVSIAMAFEAPIQVVVAGLGFGGRLLYERSRPDS